MNRLKECGLELHPYKTKSVYCKDKNRDEEYPETEFDFLGYTFRRRWVKNSKDNTTFVGFNSGVSKSAQKLMRAKIPDQNINRRSDLSLSDNQTSLNT